VHVFFGGRGRGTGLPDARGLLSRPISLTSIEMILALLASSNYVWECKVGLCHWTWGRKKRNEKWLTIRDNSAMSRQIYAVPDLCCIMSRRLVESVGHATSLIWMQQSLSVTASLHQGKNYRSPWRSGVGHCLSPSGGFDTPVTHNLQVLSVLHVEPWP